MWIAVRQYHDMVNSFIAIRFTNVEMYGGIGGIGGYGAGHNGGSDDTEHNRSGHRIELVPLVLCAAIIIYMVASMFALFSLLWFILMKKLLKVICISLAWQDCDGEHEKARNGRIRLKCAV